MAIQSVLDSNKVAYNLIDVAADTKAKDAMKAASGIALVPQIFVDGKYVGGWTEFEAAKEGE